MSDRSIIIALDAKVGGLVTGMKTAEKAVRDYGSRAKAFAQENRDDLEQVGQAGLVLGAGITAGFGLAIKTFADFDQAMSNVQASSHETEGNMDLLREAAVVAGADTAFSAVEAASAIDEMAKAGVSTADILSGGLDGALALAAAGSIDVGEAAELAATAMTQFGLSGEQLPHVADLLAAGAGKAQGSVEDMGMALKQAGLVADMTGLSIEETTGGLAAFAAAGLIGSDAGTSFKSMLQRLTPQSKEAQKAMDDLGISAYDSQGQFIGLTEFAGNLQGALADLTPEQRNAAMATMFGSDAVRAANVLYEQGAAGIAEWTEKVNDAGYAAETAALKQNNLKGDLEKLSGSIETVFLQAGSGANDVLRSLVQSLEDVTDWIGTLDPELLKTVGIMAGVTGGALLLGGAFFTMAPRVFDTIDGFKRLNASGGKTSGVLKGVGKAAGIATVALAGLQIIDAVAGKFSDGIGSVDEFSNAIRRSGADLSALNELVAYDGLGTNIEGIGDVMARVGDMNWWDDTSLALGEIVGISSRMKEMVTELENVDSVLADMVGSGNSEQAAEEFRDLAAAGKQQGMEMADVLELMPGYKDSLYQLAEAAGATLGPQELLNLAMGEIPPSMQAAADAVGTFTAATGESIPVTAEAGEALADMGLAADGTVVSLSKLLEVMLSAGLITLSAREAARGYETSLTDLDAKQEALIAEGTALNSVLNKTKTGFDITTASGKAAEAAFDGVAGAGIRSAQSMADAGDSQEAIQGSLQGTYADLVREAGQFGITGAAADSLAREVLGIPDGVSIDTWMSDFARQKAEATIGAVDRLDGKTATVTTNYLENTYRKVIDLGKSQAGTMVRPGQVGMYAEGGGVYGGIPGKDSVPILAMPGEHVWTAEEVSAAGGHGAMLQMREQILSGGVRGMADGGPVAPDSRYGKYHAVSNYYAAPAAGGGSELVSELLAAVRTLRPVTVNGVPADQVQKFAEVLNFETNRPRGKYSEV